SRSPRPPTIPPTATNSHMLPVPTTAVPPGSHPASTITFSTPRMSVAVSATQSPSCTRPPPEIPLPAVAIPPAPGGLTPSAADCPAPRGPKPGEPGGPGAYCTVPRNRTPVSGRDVVHFFLRRITLRRITAGGAPAGGAGRGPAARRPRRPPPASRPRTPAPGRGGPGAA